MTELALRAFGDDAGRDLVFLHGVTSHGLHGRRLAEEGLGRGWRVLAPDLVGHGDSPREPPWDIGRHVDAVLAAVGDGPRVWIGHSFGGRLAFEIAARDPARVERLVLLDPAILVPPHVALFAAENGRADRSYASFDEAIDRRFAESQLHHAERSILVDELSAHLVEDTDGRWRYRYTQAAVVAAYGEMASAPPPFADVIVPTLLILGESSYLSYDDLLEPHRAALGDLLEIVRVPGGHTVLWDAFDETASAIRAFIG